MIFIQTRKVLETFIKILAIIVISSIILLYGPIPNFREWLITTAMTTKEHQYLATWFYTDKTIQEVLEKHTIQEFNENTDTSLIDASIIFNNQYTSDYEKLILKDENDDSLYKLIEVNAQNYSGYLVAIYDSSKIKTAIAQKPEGEFLTDMMLKNNAVVGINGGMFEEIGEKMIATGITVSNGKVISQTETEQGIIGFTEDHKLFLGKITANEIEKYKIKDCVTFGPFLIVNGKKATISGNGGWGTAPRTAIGQRRDGTVLFLVIDGRTLTRPGATMRDISDIMEKFGAYNAANLDGGASTQLVINNQIINNVSINNNEGAVRRLVTSFIVEK